MVVCALVRLLRQLCKHSFEYAAFRYLFTEALNELIFPVNSPQMWMNVRSMEPVQTTPPVQTPLVLLYAPAMKDS